MFEAGLATGSAAAANSEFACGTFTLSDTDGLDDIASVTINGTTVPIGSLVNASVHGCARHADGDGVQCGDGCCELRYELTSPTTDLADLEQDVVPIDGDGRDDTSSPAAMMIEIVDDVSNAVNDTNSVAEGTVAPITGNVLTNDLHPNGQPGADTPRSFVSWGAATGRTARSSTRTAPTATR